MRGTISGVNGVGGICSFNNGQIINSYADTDVSGSISIGGLAGTNQETITNSHVAGSVSTDEFNLTTDGLTGFNTGTLRNSYSVAIINGDFAGGLVGINSGGSAPDSYWDTDASKKGTSARGMGKTTSELRTPGSNDGIYENWKIEDWDFGTPDQYPAVKYARGSDNNNPACGTSQQPECGTLLPGQRDVSFGANTTSTITIMSPTVLTMQKNTTTDTVVSIADNNFDVNDFVTLTAGSSDETIVSVMALTETNNITTNTNITFTLTALEGGMATITFTATDSQGQALIRRSWCASIPHRKCCLYRNCLWQQ